MGPEESEAEIFHRKQDLQADVTQRMEDNRWRHVSVWRVWFPCSQGNQSHISMVTSSNYVIYTLLWNKHVSRKVNTTTYISCTSLPSTGNIHVINLIDLTIYSSDSVWNLTFMKSRSPEMWRSVDYMYFLWKYRQSTCFHIYGDLLF